jgi:hypothetical protein
MKRYSDYVSSKWKPEVFFASLLPVAFSLEFAIRLLASSAVKDAALDAFKQMSLFWLLFHFALWYLQATDKVGADGELRSNITTLNLKDREI